MIWVFAPDVVAALRRGEEARVSFLKRDVRPKEHQVINVRGNDKGLGVVECQARVLKREENKGARIYVFTLLGIPAKEESV